MFLAPVHLYDSGFSGNLNAAVADNTKQLFAFAVSILLNIPFFIYGYHKQGLCFTVYSVFAVCSYSAASYIFTYVIPYDFAAASPFAGKDLLLCAIFGGIISGIGSGLTIRCGGAIDGVEVMAVIFCKENRNNRWYLCYDL